MGSWNASGLVWAGCVAVGAGIGMLAGRMLPWVVIGAGVGMLLMAYLGRGGK